MLKEKLREKLELEKRALKVVERLLEDSVAEDFLIDCVCTRSSLLTKKTIKAATLKLLPGVKYTSKPCL